MANANVKIPEFDFKGIKRITIPKLDSDFTASNQYGWATIKKYLPRILATHTKNAEKIKYLYEYWLGEQDIRAKKREHDINKENNNKEVENHAYRQVDFKVGFLCGERRDYTHKADSDSDDLTILDRYFTDCKFFSKDIDLKEWIYTTGIGVTYTKPRTDIIVQDGVIENDTPKYRYATADEGFDIKYEAPFTFECVDPQENFNVYSSSFGKEALFSVSYVTIDLDEDNGVITEGKEILIETRYASFRFKSDKAFGTFYWEDGQVITTPKSLRYLPLIEYSVNKDRYGIIEKNRSSFNTINLIRSSVNDMVVDNANAILVFKNVDIESDEVKEMRKAGAIIISDSQTVRQGGSADLKTITMEIPFDKLAIYIDQVIVNAYDIVGVPMASGQVTSGGDTGQARLLGGGWNNAYIIIHKEIQSLLGYDYDQLKLFLMLCKQVPNCPVNQLFASQIDINYRVNQNDNLLVKTQSMKYLYDIHCDLEFILKVCGLSNDIKTDKKNWQAMIDKFNEMEKAKETIAQDSVETIEVEENTVNNSQE